MYRQAASFQNSTRHGSFSDILKDRQDARPKQGKRKPSKRQRGNGPLTTHTGKDAAEALRLLKELREAVKRSCELKARREAGRAMSDS